MPMCWGTVLSSRFSVADQSALDCSWRGGVWAGVPISLFELLAGAETLHVNDAIDGEDAVEVIDFVLQEFGEIAIVSGVQFVPFGAQVLIADGDFTVPFDLHEDRQEAKAGVPDNDFLRAALDNFGIHQGPRFGPGQLQED